MAKLSLPFYLFLNFFFVDTKLQLAFELHSSVWSSLIISFHHHGLSLLPKVCFVPLCIVLILQKIADFGLAERLENPDMKHFTMCGTPNYMSP